MSDRPILFIDTETTSLDRKADIWEFAGVRRNPDGSTEELHLFIEHSKAECSTLPESFLADHRARFPHHPATRREAVARGTRLGRREPLAHRLADGRRAMIGGPTSPHQYVDATEDNPLTFGINCERYGQNWVTRCDGMPSMFGCGSEIVTPTPYRGRPSSRPKRSGWLICYGEDDDGSDDHRIVLAFCPRCAEVMRRRKP